MYPVACEWGNDERSSASARSGSSSPNCSSGCQYNNIIKIFIILDYIHTIANVLVFQLLAYINA